MKTIDLAKSPTMFRTARAAVAEVPQIDMSGGMFGAGIIRDVSVITTGEALGHDLFIDQHFLQQTAEALQAAGDAGIKSRFTHPGMSSDGLGRHLGRITFSRLEADRVIGDLHFAKSAHNTPDGNLAEYVSTLVQEDPQAAGLSIVFNRDFAAEVQLLEDNSVDGEFVSPDPLNANGHAHARLSELRAADLVDEPAANPDGMFDSMPVARDVDACLAFALGLESKKPADELFGINVDRAAAFLSRFFTSRGLAVVSKDTVQESQPEPVVAPVTRESFAAELSRYVAKFGADNGAKWFSEGKSFEQCLELYCEALAAERDKALAEAEEAKGKLASLSLGEKEELPTLTPEQFRAPKKTLSQLMNPQAN